MQSNLKIKWISSKQCSHELIQISTKYFAPSGPQNLPGPQQRKNCNMTFKIMLGFVIAALRKLADLLATSHTLPTSLPVVLKSEVKLTLKT